MNIVPYQEKVRKYKENCRELIEELNLDIQKHYSSVEIGGGENFYIIRKIKLAVRYKNTEKDILFYLCPYLQQELYLDIDFWRAFELAPDVVNPIQYIAN